MTVRSQNRIKLRCCSAIILLTATIATAGLTVSESSPCSVLSRPEHVLQCALSNHPAIQRAESGLKQGNVLEDVAGQIANPELSSKTTFGVGSASSTNLEVNLSQPIEFGGKRAARKEKAVAERESLSSEIIKIKEEVFLNTLLTLYRIRQLETETRLAEEALLAFHRIQKQFRSRPRLTPEQQVSFGIFQLAEGDYELKKSALTSEIKTLEKRVGLAIGRPFQSTPETLPPKKSDWPKLLPDGGPSSTNSSLQRANAELRAAQADLSQAKSVSWPDLKIGPTFERQPEGDTIRQGVGFNVSIALPIFNLNGAGREYAAIGVAKGEQNLSLLKTELEAERHIQLTKYTGAVEALTKVTALSNVEKTRSETENLFERGLVPSSLVIEAHRQMFEFTKSQDEQELIAIESLWRIYAIEARMFKETL